MKRIVFLDYVRVFACFLVMIVHSIENFYGAADPRTWPDRNLIWPVKQTAYG